MDSFRENEIMPKNGFLMFFGPTLSMFLRSQSYNFDAIAHAGRLLGVE